MLFASLVWATIIGEIVNVLRNANVDADIHHQTTDELLAMGKEYNLNPDLQLRLHDYFDHARRLARDDHVRDRVLSHVSTQLGTTLIQVLHSAWFDQIWWLKRLTK